MNMIICGAYALLRLDFPSRIEACRGSVRTTYPLRPSSGYHCRISYKQIHKFIRIFEREHEVNNSRELYAIPTESSCVKTKCVKTKCV